MNRLPLDKLFEKKVYLHNAKYQHIYNIFYTKRNYFGIYHSVLYMRDIIKQEIKLNQRIVKRINRLYKRKTKQKPYFFPLEVKTKNLIDVLDREFSIIKDIGMSSVIRNDYKILFSKDKSKSYLTSRCLDFKKVFEKEMIVNKELIEDLYAKNIELYGITKFRQSNKKIKEAKDLLLESQRLLKAFVKSIGNTETMQRTGKDLLSVLDAFQQTDLYEFVQQDVQKIKTKVKYVMAHPKEHKLTYLFTGIYLVSPGTFELTGAILALRYMTKYTVKKTKNLKASNSRDRSIRRKIKRSIKKRND